MKSVLSIILWIFAPMLTPYGLQIGEVKTNNQTIKIMKMNFNNPAWLQGAGNIGGGEPITRMVLTEDSNGKVQLSANGLVIVEYVQDGEIVRNTYSALSDTYVPIPAGVEANIYGAVTAINGDNDSNVFASIDVSKNIVLTKLKCGECADLTSLDVSKNAALTHLYCGDCTGLTSLDISKNAALTYLNCSYCTGLTMLDVSKNSELTSLDCGHTMITSLDVRKNVKLSELYCNNCTELTSLDVSKNLELIILGCDYCTELTSLDVSKNTALEGLSCHGCAGLTVLDVSKNSELTSLDCGDCTGLMFLDIQNATQLEIGDIFTNISTSLTTLQVAGTSEWAYEQVENWLNGDAPSGGTILVDENTPESVITAATGKSWTVEYVDAA